MTALRAEGCGIAAFGGDEYIASVTGFTLVATMLHDEEPELPSSGRGVAPEAREDRDVVEERVQKVQRVQRVHRVQRGRCPTPAGLEVMAACGGRLYRKVVFAAAQGEGGGSAAVYSPLP